MQKSGTDRLYEESIELHRKLRGKLEIKSKVKLKTRHDLSLAYTPGVAQASREIAQDRSKVYDYTIKSNTVAVVSDGSAVLGLGDIGAYAAIPVMEGKCVLFKEFAGVDAIPICVQTQDTDEIVSTVRNIAPVFGGINLEDIKAPKCFDVERQLLDLGIPVFHDDQHGTAIVVLAGLINALKVVGKQMRDARVVVCGAGAAGATITRLLGCMNFEAKECIPVKEIIVCDSKGIIYEGRKDLSGYKIDLAKKTNPRRITGGIADAMVDADVFIGVSAGGIVSGEMTKSMAEDPIIFAMANPVPEIMPDEVVARGKPVIGTGRSDLPNQINNVLAFPGVFRGALDAGATRITDEMKHDAAYAIAACMKNPTRKRILPSPLDRTVAPKVAEAVKKAAIEMGVVRQTTKK